MDLKEQSIVGCSPEFVFQFSQLLVGLRKQFINNYVFFPLGPVMLVLIIIIIIIVSFTLRLATRVLYVL